jgi:hypothetical protein
MQLISRAARIPRLSEDDEALLTEALRCFRILCRVRFTEVLGDKECAGSLVYALLPSIPPALRKITLKSLCEIAKASQEGRKKVLVALTRLRKYVLERAGRDIKAAGKHKKERFRVLVNLLGDEKEQNDEESLYITAPMKRASTDRFSALQPDAMSTSTSGLSTSTGEVLTRSDPGSSKSKSTSTEQTPSGSENDSDSDISLIHLKSPEESRKRMRLHCMRLINAILGNTESLVTRVNIRRALLDLGLLQKISVRIIVSFLDVCLVASAFEISSLSPYLVWS